MYKGKPTVLYIHGYESAPTPAKTMALSDLGFAVIAPKIHYVENYNTYERLKSLALEYQIDWLVGSSLGGYTAFWLSQELILPTLLFNPSLIFKRTDPGLVKKDLEIKNFNQTIFLGLKDTTVDPLLTQKWLEKRQILDRVKIIKNEEHAHEISLDVFTHTIQTVNPFASSHE